MPRRVPTKRVRCHRRCRPVVLFHKTIDQHLQSSVCCDGPMAMTFLPTDVVGRGGLPLRCQAHPPLGWASWVAAKDEPGFFAADRKKSHGGTGAGVAIMLHEAWLVHSSLCTKACECVSPLKTPLEDETSA